MGTNLEGEVLGVCARFIGALVMSETIPIQSGRGNQEVGVRVQVAKPVKGEYVLIEEVAGIARPTL